MLTPEEYKRRIAGLAAARESERTYRKIATSRRGPAGRTFHVKVGSVTKAAPTGRGGSPDYIARQGEYGHKDPDLESVHGRKTDEMKKILSAVHDQTKRKNGRIAIPITLELPSNISQPGKKNIVDNLVQYFEDMGHPTMAVIHGNDRVQPHMHLITTARPVSGLSVSPEGVRGAAMPNRLFVGKSAVRDFRQIVAQKINSALENDGQLADWHGGNFKDVGIERKAKKRVPEAAWARGQREIDPRESLIAWQQHEQDRTRYAAQRAEKDKRKSEYISRAEEAEAKAQDYGERLLEMMDETTSLEQNLTEAKGQLRDTVTKADQYRQQTEIFAAKLQDQTAEIDRVRTQRNDYKRELMLTKQKAEEAVNSQQLKALEAKLQDKNDDIERIQKQRNSYKLERNHALERAEKAESAYHTLKASYPTTKAEKVTTDAQRAFMKDVISRSGINLDQLDPNHFEFGGSKEIWDFIKSQQKKERDQAQQALKRAEEAEKQLAKLQRMAANQKNSPQSLRKITIPQRGGIPADVLFLDPRKWEPWETATDADKEAIAKATFAHYPQAATVDKIHMKKAITGLKALGYSNYGHSSISHSDRER